MEQSGRGGMRKGGKIGDKGENARSFHFTPPDKAGYATADITDYMQNTKVAFVQTLNL